MTIQEWINAKIAEIAERLPESVKQPASFRYGYDTGYKQCLLELDRLLEEPIDE